MAWIKRIAYEDATGKLKRLFDRVKTPDGRIDNILSVHSLRPPTLEGHMSLYKNVLHHSGNQLDKHFLEAVGVYVSMMNQCPYCVDHHYEGMRKLIGDDQRSVAVREALQAGRPELVFDGKFLLFMTYAQVLTQTPGGVQESLIQALRDAGADDGEILEINQVVSYFCYANRTVLGLGVTTEGDILGLSPNDESDSDNWSHT